MQGINCIKGEIHNVLTVLRLNSQSLSSLYSGAELHEMQDEESSLIRALKELYESICIQQDLAHVDTIAYLTPFLTVITSKHTDIFTTAIALHSIHKFLVYGLIHAESPNVAAALTQIADSVTHCTFDVTDGEDAEVVSMKILEILLECLRCSAGEFLTDQAVLDMITEALHVRSQQHSSKLLRRYAENVLMQMVLVLFARISPEGSNANELSTTGGGGRATTPSPTPQSLPRSSTNLGIGASPVRPTNLNSARHRSLSVHSTLKDWNASTEKSLNTFNAGTNSSGDTSAQALLQVPSSASSVSSSSSSSHHSSIPPYGIPALHRVFRFLTNLINPGDVRNTEQDRILGLRLIRTVLETSGTRIGTFPPLIQVIQDELCKYLLQNSQTKNLFVLSLTLRIVFDLFITVKQHLKVQLEVFFTSIHLRIGESQSSTYQQKELVLESLVEFCKEVSLIVGLYRNYDCELGCTDLFQDLCKFLANTAMQPWTPSQALLNSTAKGASSSAATLQHQLHPNQLNVLSLEGMVSVLNAIAKRFCANYKPTYQTQQYALDSNTNESRTNGSLSSSFSNPSTLTRSTSNLTGGGEESDDESTLLVLTPEEETHLLNKRANKQKLALAANQFNREGLTMKCIKYLQSLKILPPSSPPPTSADEETQAIVPSGDGGSRKPRPPPKSKHDPFIPPSSIVSFFRNTPGLDKGKIGEYLGDADVYNVRVLDAFVESFDFSAVPKTLQVDQTNDSNGTTAVSHPLASPSSNDISLDDALRSFLDGFRLPGEAQQIARIIERFSAAYYANCRGPLKSPDATYVLCYSVIMLNTDAHNPQVARKMTQDKYIHNLRGINEGEDLPRAYLENLYDSIVHNEIKLKSDNLKDMNGDENSAASWNHVLSSRARASGTNGSFQTSAPRIHGREMFLLIWQQSITIFVHYLENQCAARDGWMIPIQSAMNTQQALTTVTTTASSPSNATSSSTSAASATAAAPPSLHSDHLKILPKIVQGFSLFSRICAVYNLNDIFNNLVIALCKCLVHFFEELCEEAQWDIPQLHVAFSRDLRIRHFLPLLFSLLHEYSESHVLEGWSNCIHVLLWLRQMELLPTAWIELEDFRDSGGKPLESVRYASHNIHTPNAWRLKQEKLAQKQVSNNSGGFWGFWRSSSNTNATANGQTPSNGQDGGQAQPPAPSPAELHWISQSKEIITSCSIPQLFEDSKYFRPSSLAHLVRSLIVISSSGTKTLSPIAVGAYSPHIMHEESAVFCLERLSDVIEKNQSRLNQSHSIQEQHLAPSSTSALSSPSTPASPAILTAMTTTVTTNSSIHLWATISQHLELSIANVRNDASCTFYIERLVVNLLRFSVRLVYSKETTTQLIHLLALLLQLSKDTFAKLAQRIIAGVSLFLQTHGESISRVEEWEVIFNLLLQFKHHPFCAHSAFQTFTYVVENHCSMSTFVPLMNALTGYSQCSNEKDAWLPVAPEAVLALLLRLHSKLNSLSPTEPQVAPSPHAPDTVTPAQVRHLSPTISTRRMQEFDRSRTDLWLASLQNFCNIIKNDERSTVRRAALDALNQSLLAVGVSPPITPLGWKICFEKLLIPLLEGVQRYIPEMPTPTHQKPLQNITQPTNSRSKPGRIDDSVLPPYDIRLKAATLVFQTFLHHLDILTEMNEFHTFWLKFVAQMEKYMSQSAVPVQPQIDSNGRTVVPSNLLSLHFSESLKNLLLVMNSSNVFSTVSEKSGQNLLQLTWTVIDSFRPDLRNELQELMKPMTATVTLRNTNPSANANVNTTKPVTQSPSAANAGPAHVSMMNDARSQQQQQPQQSQAMHPLSSSSSSSTNTRPMSTPPQLQAHQPPFDVATAPRQSSLPPAASPLSNGASSIPALSNGAIDFARLAPLTSSQQQQQQQHQQLPQGYQPPQMSPAPAQSSMQSPSAFHQIQSTQYHAPTHQQQSPQQYFPQMQPPLSYSQFAPVLGGPPPLFPPHPYAQQQQRPSSIPPPQWSPSSAATAGAHAASPYYHVMPHNISRPESPHIPSLVSSSSSQFVPSTGTASAASSSSSQLTPTHFHPLAAGPVIAPPHLNGVAIPTSAANWRPQQQQQVPPPAYSQTNGAMQQMRVPPPPMTGNGVNGFNNATAPNGHYTPTHPNLNANAKPNGNGNAVPQ